MDYRVSFRDFSGMPITHTVSFPRDRDASSWAIQHASRNHYRLKVEISPINVVNRRLQPQCGSQARTTHGKTNFYQIDSE